MSARASRTNKEPARTLVIAPHGSLSVPYACLFFGGMCAMSVVIASILTWQGVWLIWPFAAVSMGMLAAGLYSSMRHNRYREVVSVYEDRIEVDAGHGQPERHWEFPRLLTQVRLDTGSNRNSPSRLLLIRCGHGCELGRCLNEEERAAVAMRIKKWVRTPELGTTKVDQ